LLNLLAEAVQALQRLLHIGLPRRAADLRLQLTDRPRQRLLAVLDGALDLAANIARYTALSLAEGFPAGGHRTAHEA